MKHQYKHVCLGGTFDHLHAGHKRILDFAFNTGKKVTIGITTDPFIQQKVLSQSIQSFDRRKEYLLNYLTKMHFDKRAFLFPLDTIYGIADRDISLEAIIVTRETHANAVKINQRRAQRNLVSLDILCVPFLKGEDSKIVRAERIRKGSIDRMGKSYIRLFNSARQLNLPDHLRDLLRIPLGSVIEGEEQFARATAEKAFHEIKTYDPILTILVGDIVADSLLEVGFKPEIIIRDNRSRRKDLLSRIHQPKGLISNPPGTISRAAVRAIQKAIMSSKKLNTLEIIVNGEEDLLALPAILLSPLHSIVVYGQAGMGIVVTVVTEAKKEQIAKIVGKFE